LGTSHISLEGHNILCDVRVHDNLGFLASTILKRAIALLASVCTQTTSMSQTHPSSQIVKAIWVATTTALVGDPKMHDNLGNTGSLPDSVSSPSWGHSHLAIKAKGGADWEAP